MRPTDATVKSCCASLYASDWARLLLGDSFHPGGLDLTERLGTLLQLGPETRVLDVAAGNGASACFLAQRFDCPVVGIDYGAEAVDAASVRAGQAGVADRVSFETGDAERLPFDDGSFDALVCECAFCTFPDKPQAAREFARVLRPGGTLGLSDLTRMGPLPDGLETLLAWVACLGDARPIGEYAGYMRAAGFAESLVEVHDDALRTLVREIRGKLVGAELLVKLGQLQLPVADFAQAKSLARSAAAAIDAGWLGYSLLIARR